MWVWEHEFCFCSLDRLSLINGGVKTCASGLQRRIIPLSVFKNESFFFLQTSFLKFFFFQDTSRQQKKYVCTTRQSEMNRKYLHTRHEQAWTSMSVSNTSTQHDVVGVFEGNEVATEAVWGPMREKPRPQTSLCSNKVSVNRMAFNLKKLSSFYTDMHLYMCMGTYSKCRQKFSLLHVKLEATLLQKTTKSALTPKYSHFWNFDFFVNNDNIKTPLLKNSWFLLYSFPSEQVEHSN